MRPSLFVFARRLFAPCSTLFSTSLATSFSNANEQKHYSLLKTIGCKFSQLLMGDKGQSSFNISFFISFKCVLIFIGDEFFFFSAFLEVPMSPTPFDYDPFDALKKHNFSDEEFERCFRYFDSLQYVCLNRYQEIHDIIFRQGSWTREDFRQFLSSVFSNKKRPYCILSDLVEQYFQETDFNQVNQFISLSIDSDYHLHCLYSSFRMKKLISMNFYKHGKKQ